MKTDFLASGNHFLPFSQTAVNCCLECSFFFNWDIFLSQFFIPTSEWKILSTGNSIFFIPSSFPLMENITETWGKSSFIPAKYTPASEHLFFQYFQRFWNYLKWNQPFRKVETHFSYVSITPRNCIHQQEYT